MSMRILLLAFLIGACNDPVKPKIVTKPFAVRVTESDPTTPIAGAKIAVDDANGLRKEGDTDATGIVTLDIDWRNTPVAVTAWAADHTVVSVLGVTESPDYHVHLVRFTAAAPTTHTISGQILNKLDAGDYVSLSASVSGGSFQDATTDYTLDVYEDKPFSIFALDFNVGTKGASKRGVSQLFKKWTQIDAPAPSTSTTVDIDFSAGTELTPVRTSGTIKIPGGANGPLKQSSFYMVVDDADSSYSSFLGAPLFADVSSDLTQFQFDLEYVKPAAVTKPLTRYFLSNPSGAFSARADENAWPSDSPAITDLLEMPVVTNAAGHLPIALGTAPEFAPITGDVQINLIIRSNFGTINQRTVWVVEAPLGTPLITPALPTGVDADAALPPASLTGHVQVCSPANATLWCHLITESEPYAISR